MAKFRHPARSASPARDPLGKVYPYVLPLLLFFALVGISRPFAVGFAAVCFVLAAGRTPMAQLCRRFSPLTLAAVLYALVYLASGLWCHFGEYAGRESIKMLVALVMFGLVLTRTEKDKLSRLLWAVNGVLAVVALLCIDAGSCQLLTRGFSALMRLFRCEYALSTMGYESGIRITGIFSNANVSAGLIAFGLVFSLYLYRTAACEKGRMAAAIAVGVEALAFFLSFSMGAMAAFAVTCLVYVLCTKKGGRLPLFLLMLECVVITVICAFGCYPFLGTSSILPVLLAFVCGAVIWALDRFVGRKLAAALEERGKLVGITGGVLVALAIVYVVLAVNVTGGITLNAHEKLSRAIYPDAGEYTVTVEGIGAQVQVYTQNEAQLMMHTNTVLYEGPLSEARFTVPDDSKVVWFVLSGDGVLNAVTLSDGTELPLGYKLLPGFAANRLQGLKANQNFIQRLVFFQDGLKLWKQSPVIGWGIGGVEGQLTAVQSFYYESKYIHNQFIQIMVEAGILGLASFLGLLGSAIWMLLRRKEEDDPLLAMLAACVTMMTAHSLTEVVWSTQMYQVMVYVIFAMIIVRCGSGDEKKPAMTGRAAAVVLWAVVLVFTTLQGTSLAAAKMFADAQTDEDLTRTTLVEKLDKLAAMEFYDDSPYLINAMANGIQSDSILIQSIATKSAQALMATEEFDSCYHVAAYYYLPLRNFDGFFEITRVGLVQEASNPDAWDSIANLYAQACQSLTPEELEEFLPGVAQFQARLNEFNASGRMEQIQLTAENQAFLDCAASLSGVDGQQASLVLNALLGA